MRPLRRLARLLRNVLRRSRVERDLDAEVRGMFELLVEQKIAEGLAPRAARRGTALELGTVESMKTEVRDARAGGWLDVLRQDVRDAWRGLSAGKGTTALAFSILALAIAAGTVTFSVVDAVALRPLPYGNPENLVGIAWLTPKYADPMPAMGRDYVAWRDAVPALESIAAAGGFPAPVQVQLNGTTVALTEGRVTAALFEVLGVRPALGRLFRADDEQPGRSAVAVLPHESWMRHFGGDPAAIGRVLTMGDARREIVGVLPVGVMFPVGDQATDIFVIETETPTSPYLPVEVVARLRPGATIAQVSGQIERVSPVRTADGARPVVLPLLDRVVGSAKVWLLLVLAAVGLVLLVACVNVASLLLARATIRVRELATREALGASRARLARVLIFEGVLLAAASAAAGVVASFWGVALAKAQLPETLARASTITVDARVLGVSIAVSLLCGLLCASAPAWATTRSDLLTLMKTSGGAVIGGPRRTRPMRTFLVAEVAFVTVLLVATTLAVTSFILITTADLGFDRRNVATVGWSRNWQEVPQPDRAAAAATFRRELLERTGAVPGVVAAALTTNSAPLSGGMSRSALTIPGYGRVAGDVMFEINHVTPSYFTTMGLRVRRGRLFDDSDRLGAPRVALINEMAASRFFGSRDPLGEVVILAEPATIVGILQSVRLRGPEQELRPELYMPIDQSAPTNRGTLIVRTSSRSRGTVQAISAAVRPVLGSVSDPEFIETFFSRLTAARRFNAGVMGVFGLLAIAIGAVGIYGTMAFTVAQQVKAIGLRMALGASRGQILVSVLREAWSRVLVGLLIGLAAAWALSRLFAVLVFGVTTTEPAIYLMVAIVLVLVGIVAAFVPASRAARVDPLVALRTE